MCMYGVCPGVRGYLSVFKELYLSMWEACVYVYLGTCTCPHGIGIWKVCKYGFCGNTCAPEGEQMRPLPLEDNIEQYKDSWAKLESWKIKDSGVGSGVGWALVLGHLPFLSL